MENFTFTDWDGSSHSFPGTRDCNNGNGQYFTFTENFPLATRTVMSNDEALYVLDASNTADIRVIKRDGTVYHFSNYRHEPITAPVQGYVPQNQQDYTTLNFYASIFSSIVDPNGNTITATPGLDSASIVDTVGRTISVVPNITSNGYGYKITYQAQSGSGTQQVNATSAPLTNSTTMVQWPVSYSTSGGPCTAFPPNQAFAGLGMGTPTVTYQGPGMPGWPSLPANSAQQITLPNGASYTLTFDMTGNVVKVVYPSGGYTKYDYLYGRIVQSKNFSDVNCSSPSNELLAKHECSLASSSCSPAPTSSAPNSCVAGFPNGGEATTCYAGLFSAQPAPSGGGTFASVTDPYGNLSTHASAGNMIMPGNGPSTYLPFYKASDHFYSGQSQLLKSITYTYTDSATGCSSAAGPWMLQPCDITTTSAAGNSTISSVTKMQYDPASNNLSHVQEYDFSGNLLKSTIAVWASGGIYSSGMTISNTNVVSGPAGVTTLYNMLDHLQSLTVTDGVTGKSNAKAFTYDSKGNLTQTSVSGSDVATMSTIYTPLDSYGRPTQVQDPRGNITSYSYSDSWYDATCAPSSDSKAYLTSVTNAANQITTYKYDSCTGELGSVTDPNNQTTSFSFDTMGRNTRVDYPDHGWVQNAFTDVAPLSIQTTKTQSPNPNVVDNVVLDGLARPSRSQLSSDPAGADTTDTKYDALGRLESVSNPYRSGDTVVATQYGYDALGRKTIQTQPDGNTLHWCYNGIVDPQNPQSNCRTNLSSFSSGSWVDSADEASNNWQRVSDAAGHLRSVIEPYSHETDYGYSGFGDLLRVDQWAGSPGSPYDHLRIFGYDSLSRLITSTNPETGTICYGQWSGGICSSGYDANGNLLHKTDARGLTVNYAYDALNRLTQKSYSDGVSSTILYGYDVASLHFTGLQGFTAALANTVGRPAYASVTGTINPSGASLYAFSYDAMGRLTNQWVSTPSHAAGISPVFASSARYDLAGNMTDLTYPDLRTATQSFDSAGRLLSVKAGTSTSPGAPYVSNITYSPSGSPQSMTYGDPANGVVETLYQNSRLQPCHTVAVRGTMNLMDRKSFYTQNMPTSPCGAEGNNNGNIFHIVDALGLGPNSEDFTYDALNRLTSFSGPQMAGMVRQQNYSYDSFGNVAATKAYATATPDNTGTPMARMFGNINYNPATWPYDTNNHLIDSTFDCSGPGGTGHYDAAGNVLCGGSNTDLDAKQYTWDSESRITRVGIQHNGNTYDFAALYTYDANGSRIRSDLSDPSNTSVPSKWREYNFFNGHMLAEQDQSGNWTDYIYANGQKFAQVDAQKPLLHMHGERNSSNLACGTAFG